MASIAGEDAARRIRKKDAAAAEELASDVRAEIELLEPMIEADIFYSSGEHWMSVRIEHAVQSLNRLAGILEGSR